MDKNIIELKSKIKNSDSESEKEELIVELKKYVNSLPDIEYQKYRNETITDIESRFEIMDKLFEAYELMKKRTLQHS